MGSGLRFTKTTHGARKLIYQGYMFTRHKEVAEGERWRCDQRNQFKCSGAVVLDENDRVVRAEDHNHAADWGRCKARECVVQLKETAATSRASTSAIVQSGIARVSSETAVKLPKAASLRKAVRRVKRQPLPPEPKSFADLREIPDALKRSLKGK